GSNNTRARLRATIEYTIRDFDITVDLCPVREPQYKGKNERSNQHLEKHLFEDSHNEGPYLAEDLEDLNKKIRIDLIRINSKPEKGRLSRMAIFEKYEKVYICSLFYEWGLQIFNCLCVLFLLN
ncbi:MAG: hypothetical protein K6G84_04565, partial [Lachnospiraceae bacterium]|nr:hypothetical protein [Lachnospiraceae bacterium]